MRKNEKPSKSNSYIDAGKTLLVQTRNYPQFKLPKDFRSKTDFLESVVMRKLPNFYPNAESKILERIDVELDFLGKTGLDNAFLIAADLLETMRIDGFSSRCFWGNASGSVVAYILGITEFDPIKFGLVFEGLFALINSILSDFRIYEDPYVVEAYLREKYENVVHNGGGLIAVGNFRLPELRCESFRSQVMESGAMIIGAVPDEFDITVRELSEMLDGSKMPSDAEVFEFFTNADKHFFGIPHFQSKSAKEYANKLKPDSLSELALIFSCNRPGRYNLLDELVANKRNPICAQGLHPVIDEITKETYGAIVFKEQWLEAMCRLAGCDYATANEWRKNFAKKMGDSGFSEKILGRIAVNLQVGEKDAEEMFNFLGKYADSAFSKAFSLFCVKSAFEIARLRVALLNRLRS